MNLLLRCVILLALTGCGSVQPLLNADFDADPLGGLPLEFPPGAPEGDVVRTGILGEIAPGYLTITEDERLPGRCLRLREVPGDSRRIFRFFGRELTGLPYERIRVSWQGVADPDASEPQPVVFALIDHTNDFLGQIEITREDKLGTYDAPTSGDITTLGRVTPGVSHSVSWTFDFTTDRQRLTLFQPDADDPSRSANIVMDWTPMFEAREDIERFGLLVQQGSSVGGEATYFMDEVRISILD